MFSCRWSVRIRSQTGAFLQLTSAAPQVLGSAGLHGACRGIQGTCSPAVALLATSLGTLTTCPAQCLVSQARLCRPASAVAGGVGGSASALCVCWSPLHPSPLGRWAEPQRQDLVPSPPHPGTFPVRPRPAGRPRHLPACLGRFRLRPGRGGWGGWGTPAVLAVGTFGDLAFGDIFLHLLTGSLALPWL